MKSKDKQIIRATRQQLKKQKVTGKAPMNVELNVEGIEMLKILVILKKVKLSAQNVE